MNTDKLSPMMEIFSWRGPSISVATPKEAECSDTARPVSLPKLPYEIGIKVTREGFVLSMSPEATEEQLAEVLRALRLARLQMMFGCYSPSMG